MSLSGSKSKTKQQQQSQQNATQNTTLNPWSQTQFEDQSSGLLGAIGNYNKNSPFQAYTGQMVAGISPGEQQTRQMVQQGSGAGQMLGSASDMAMRAGNAGPSTMQAAQVNGLLGYNPADIGKAQTYNSTNMNAASVGNMDQIGNRIGEVGKYMNPELNSVVNTTLAGYDEDAARQRASMQARAAGAGAFGGSRYGVAEGVYDADTSRNRASTEAQLRSSAYDRATGLLGTDVGSVNTGRLTQAGFEQQAQAQNAAAQNAALAANVAAQNQRESERAQMAQQAGMFSADVNNQGLLANAGFQQQTNQFNAGAQEQAAQRQLQASGVMGNLAGQLQQNFQQNAQLMRQLGLDDRQIEQARLDAQRAEFDRAAADRLQRLQLELQARTGLLGSTPMLTNQTSSGTASGTSSGTKSENGWGLSAGFTPADGLTGIWG